MVAEKKIAKGAAAAFLFIALICAMLVGAQSAIETHDLADGARRGFSLTGSYAYTTSDGFYDLSFWEDDEAHILWGIRKTSEKERETLCHGAALPTPDPNLYILCDEIGNKVGIAHLAYVDDESRGSLFIGNTEDSFVEFQRQGSVPIRMIT